MRILSFCAVVAAALSATNASHGQASASTPIAGYSFMFTNDSSRALSNNVPGYRMWVHATPTATRIDFAAHASPYGSFGLIDRRSRMAIVPGKADNLEGSIDALGGPLGALAWPDEHPDRDRNIVVRDSTVAGADSLLGRPALHRHFTLTYGEYRTPRTTTEDCWYIDEPEVVHDAVNHASRFFGLASAKDAALAFAIWSKTSLTPVKCTTVVTLDDRPQYALRITHETWVVADIHTDDFDAAMFMPPAGPRVTSPHQPFKPD